jgi:NAD(P)-dependent dehydrogenase (short-subunit alcohol dehydrogenase family)
MAYFAEKIAIVTGAASGIGRGLCEALCAKGAVVYAADIQRTGLDELVESATGTGEIRGVTLDVTSRNDFERLVRDVVEEHGRLDLIVNNAVIRVVGDFRQTELDDIRRATEVNQWGVVYGTKAAYEAMTAQGQGHIVNIASSAGVMPVPMQTAYAMDKHAVVGLSRSLRIEAAAYGVKVSVVLPGLVDTDFFATAKAVGDYDYEKEMESLPVRPIPPRRAADLILAGIKANRELIIFPTSNRLVLWLFRYFPGVMTPFLAKATTGSLPR